MDATTQANRIIVVGTSAGGPDTLRRLVAGLEPDLPAAVLIVQHLPPDSPGLLPAILENAGPLPAAFARDGDALIAGRILLAPANRHLLVAEDGAQGRCARVTRGPRENRSRPSIDVLFRSAAVAGDGRTVGVLLTGMLDDGALGLRAIQRSGGVTVVQEPAEAPYPGMVETALATGTVDYRLPVAQIAKLLNRLAAEPAGESVAIPADLQFEVGVSLAADSEISHLAEFAEATTFSCPECGGRLWQTADEDLQRYLCEVGHAYNQETLLQGMDREVERSLWVALRTLEERERMLGRMAEEESGKGRERLATDLRERAAETRRDSENVRRFLLSNGR